MAKRISIPASNDINVHGEWTAGDSEVLRVYTSQYQGRTTVQMRVWWQNRDGEWLPGGKGRGMVLPLEVGGVTDEIGEAIASAIAEVTSPRAAQNGNGADAKLVAENKALNDRLASLETLIASLAAGQQPAEPAKPVRRTRKTATAK